MSSADALNSIATAASAIMLPASDADDMYAQHAVGLGVGENFHETFGLLVRLWRGRLP